jgi:hypothetical protein
MADGVPLPDAGVDQHHDDGSDDRSDDAGGLEEAVVGVFVEDQVAEKAPDERADDAEHNGHQDADVLPAGDEQTSHRSGDESDDDEADDQSDHGETFRWRTPSTCGVRRCPQGGTALLISRLKHP